MVPWSSDESWTLEVLAHWSGQFSSTPLWLYIKRAGLPSTTDFDKTYVVMLGQIICRTYFLLSLLKNFFSFLKYKL